SISTTITAGTYYLVAHSDSAAHSNDYGDVGQYTITGTLPPDATPPTAVLAPVSPNPRNTAVGTVGISFCEPVNGLDINDFTLTRNGNPVSLSGLTINGSGASYSIDLSSVTATAGNYVLTLVASGSFITDAAGNPLSGNASDSWTTDTTPPT